MLTYEEIENLILAQLDPLKDAAPAGLGVRELDTYRGDLNPEDLVRVTLNFPAVWLMYSASTFVTAHLEVDERMNFTALAAAQNLRSEKNARAGAYKLLEGVRDLILHKKLDSELEPCLIVGHEKIVFVKGIAIYAADYQIRRLFTRAYS